MNKIRKNLIVCIVSFLCVIILGFILPRALPGDPIAYLTGFDEEEISTESYAYYKHALHLDENIFAQFGYYIKSLVDGSLGYSYKKEQTVAVLISSRISATLQITLSAVLICSAMALAWGLNSGYKQGAADKVSTASNIVINCLPSFLIGMFLMILLCFENKIFSYTGLNSYGVQQDTPAYFFDRIYHLTLPVATLVIAMLPSRYLSVRNMTRQAISSKYFFYARQRGLSPIKIKYKYVLPNIVQPFVYSVGLSVGSGFGGSVVVENLFSIKGMGTLLTEAVSTLDYPLLQGILFVTASVSLLCIFCCDLICLFLTPEIRKGGTI